MCKGAPARMAAAAQARRQACGRKACGTSARGTRGCALTRLQARIDTRILAGKACAVCMLWELALRGGRPRECSYGDVVTAAMRHCTAPICQQVELGRQRGANLAPDQLFLQRLFVGGLFDVRWLNQRPAAGPCGAQCRDSCALGSSETILSLQCICNFICSR